MLIGLVGKPSCGKSTFFKACTLANVEIASYPFTTIKPNQGVGFVRVTCPEVEFNLKSCNPQHGYCVNGKRFVPVELMDVAGLVKGASKGKGLGNQFLDDLTSADAFIHIIDVSGETDAEGKETKVYNPVQDVQMLENELDLWYLGILKKVWKSFAKKVQSSKQEFAKAVAVQFSGLKVKEEDVKQVLLKGDYNVERPAEWSEEELLKFAHELRHLTKPMLIAANKCDKESSRANIDNLKKDYPELIIIPCSSDSELALREASKAELIDYIPGDSDFSIKGDLSDKQKSALESINKNVLEVYENTGIQQVLNAVVFDLLKYISVFPVENEHHFTSKKGNVLPDAYLLASGSTALDLAYVIHTNIGGSFVSAIDARTKKKIGKDSKLKNKDVVKIITR